MDLLVLPTQLDRMHLPAMRIDQGRKRESLERLSIHPRGTQSDVGLRMKRGQTCLVCGERFSK